MFSDLTVPNAFSKSSEIYKVEFTLSEKQAY